MESTILNDYNRKVATYNDLVDKRARVKGKTEHLQGELKKLGFDNIDEATARLNILKNKREKLNKEFKLILQKSNKILKEIKE